MATLVELDSVRPAIGRDVRPAPTAVPSGGVRLGAMLAAGLPARVKKLLSGSAERWTETAGDVRSEAD